MGDRVHIRYYDSAQTTPPRQIVFFAESLATFCVFDHWMRTGPLRQSSPNAPSPRHAPSTPVLGIPAASRRYAQIAGLRGEAMASKVLAAS